MKHQSVLLQNVLKNFLISPQFSNLQFDTSIALFCKTISQAMQVTHVSIWAIDYARSRMTLQARHSLDAGGPVVNETLGLKDVQRFMDKIVAGHMVSCKDAMTADACADLARAYLPARGIKSVLAVPLHCCGRVCGVLLLEQTGAARDWTQAEVDFVTSFSGLASQAFALKDHAPPAPDSMAVDRRTRFYAAHIPDWYWETDDQFRVVSVTSGRAEPNPQMQKMIGYRLWEIPEFYPTNCTWLEFEAQVKRKVELDGLIFTSLPRKGSQRYGEVTARPIYDGAGVFQGYWGISRDVTSSIDRERALQTSETKYLNAVRLANVGSWVWDEIDGCLTYCSPELAFIYGVGEDELMARTQSMAREASESGLHYKKDLSWVHPDDRAEYRKVTETAARNQTGYDTVMRIIRDDGSTCTLHERCEPVFDATGRFIETTGVLMDITAQEAAKREVAENRAQIANLMDNIPGAVYRVKNDRHRTPIYASAGFNALFTSCASQHDTTRVKDLNLSDLIADDYLEMIRDAIAVAVENDEAYEFEFPVKHNDGKTVWISNRGRPVISDSGELEFEGILIDVTKKHEAEQSLLKAQRLEAIGQLTGGIAHDFNNLLAVILGNLELLRDEVTDTEHIEFIDAGIGATWRGAELTKNMLSFARQAKLRPTMLDLNDIVAETQKWVTRTLPENISVQLNTGAELWPVRADRSSSESALLNLIVNARDAMPHGGHLTIETRNMVIDAAAAGQLDAGRYVVLSVSDTGVGMSEPTIDRIFEPFYTTKTAGSGSGLGLPMIDGFMKQSGGAVRVISEPDKGTTFEIYFQASLPDQIEKPTVSPPPKAVNYFDGAKALVAEDEPDVLRIVTKTLEHLGCVVVPAINGDEALRLFEGTPDFDLLVTDIVMPGQLMGTHLASAVRKIRPDLPVIFMSGHADEALVRGNGLREHDIRLNKPASRSSLIAAVKRALSGE